MQDVLNSLKAYQHVSGVDVNIDIAKDQFPHFFRTHPGPSNTLSDIHRAWLLWYTVLVRNKCLRKWKAGAEEISGLTALMNKLMAPADVMQKQAFVWDLDGDPDDADQHAFDRVMTDVAPYLKEMNLAPLSTAEIYEDFSNLSEPEMLYLFCRLFGSRPLRCEYEELSRKP
jgi:hypothetical protein